ncbi:Autophagy-related protein 9 like [Verticillium longisporum]|nr:Autophagy-related protein 9 like [Verticillium longisporum]
MVATTSVTAPITSSNHPQPEFLVLSLPIMSVDAYGSLSESLSSRVTKSFYEELRGASREDEDIENNAAADLDESNWNQHFLDQDLDGLAIEDSRTTADGTANLIRQAKKTPQNRPAVSNHWHGSGREDEGDNDVPASLLVEANEAEQIGKSTHPRSAPCAIHIYHDFSHLSYAMH